MNNNIKSWEKFNESINKEIEVTIDGFKYLIKKANIDVSQFDYEGSCDRYAGSYVVIEEGDDEDSD